MGEAVNFACDITFQAIFFSGKISKNLRHTLSVEQN